MRQWVLSVPKRLRYFMQRDGPVLNIVLRIFLRAIAQTLQSHSPSAANVGTTALHIGAVAFIHRLGSSLNEHVHFHVCAVDGVFEEVAGGTQADAQADADASADHRPPARQVIFHPASAIDEVVVQEVQATLPRRILRMLSPAYANPALTQDAPLRKPEDRLRFTLATRIAAGLEAQSRAAELR